MSDKDKIAFGSARAYHMAEEDENAACMIYLNTKDRGTPFEPIGPSGGVKRGGTGKGDSDFIRQAEEACRKGETVLCLHSPGSMPDSCVEQG